LQLEDHRLQDTRQHHRLGPAVFLRVRGRPRGAEVQGAGGQEQRLEEERNHLRYDAHLLIFPHDIRGTGIPRTIPPPKTTAIAAC
jgi:hypothetical protein